MKQLKILILFLLPLTLSLSTATLLAQDSENTEVTTLIPKPKPAANTANEAPVKVQADADIPIQSQIDSLHHAIQRLVQVTPRQINNDEDFDLLVNIILGFIILIGGYLSKWIPGINKIESNLYRVGAISVATLLGFTVFKGDFTTMNLLTWFTSYGGVSLLYQLFFKNILKTPIPLPKEAK